MRALPAARAAATEPASTRSSKEMTSALMNPRWKSVWMTPAASGAVAALRILQAHRLEQLQSLVVRQLDELGFDLGVQEHGLGGGDDRRQAGAQALVGELV